MVAVVPLSGSVTWANVEWSAGIGGQRRRHLTGFAPCGYGVATSGNARRMMPAATPRSYGDRLLRPAGGSKA